MVVARHSLKLWLYKNKNQPTVGGGCSLWPEVQAPQAEAESACLHG